MRKPYLYPLPFTLFLAVTLSAAVDLRPRVFFSDAKISFVFPEHWDLQPGFPYGPLFTRETREGPPALIACAISASIDPNHIASDIPHEQLQRWARQDLATHQPGFKTLAERGRELAGRHAYEITWENAVDARALEHQSVYFFVENRVYALSLQSGPRSFKWLAPAFNHWLSSLRVLSRADSGSLADPAHGGLWIHQTGGLKIPVPEDWLIAVADDRTLGATLARDGRHADLTAAVDVALAGNAGLTVQERAKMRSALWKKGYRLVKESEEVFHALPATRLQYEGEKEDRLIAGQDIWVAGPKGRWLFSLEGDVSLYHALQAQYTQILKEMQFL